MYLTHMISLLAYSFEGDEDCFEEFLDVFKESCLLVYGTQVNMIPLLDAITHETVFKNRKFFGTLKHTNHLLRHLIKQVEDKIVTEMDPATVDDLI